MLPGTYLTIEGALKLLKKKTSISTDEKAAIHFTQAALSRDIAAINTNSLVLRLDQALTEIFNLDKSAREISSHIPDRFVRAELLTKTERAGAYLDDLARGLRESPSQKEASTPALVTDHKLKDS